MLLSDLCGGYMDVLTLCYFIEMSAYHLYIFLCVIMYVCTCNISANFIKISSTHSLHQNKTLIDYKYNLIDYKYKKTLNTSPKSHGKK